MPIQRSCMAPRVMAAAFEVPVNCTFVTIVEGVIAATST